MFNNSRKKLNLLSMLQVVISILLILFNLLWLGLLCGAMLTTNVDVIFREYQYVALALLISWLTTALLIYIVKKVEALEIAVSEDFATAILLSRWIVTEIARELSEEDEENS